MTIKYIREEPQSTPRWRFIERTVAVLEKFITPGARVQLDIKLPVLGGKRRRQCDVVVWTGTAPRETLTIVEVQDRRRPVGIEVFDGWCRKRERLGAQHLICVSAKGFTKGVQEDAARQGGTVRLVTLTEPRVPPTFFQAKSVLVNIEVLIKRDITAVFADRIPPEISGLRVDSKAFVVPGCSEPRSLMEIAEAEWLARRVTGLATRSLGRQIQREYRIAWPDSQVRFPTDSASVPVPEIFVVDVVEHMGYDMPVRLAAYEQIGYGAALAWMVMATGNHQGEELAVQFPIRQDPTGRIRIGRTEIRGPSGYVFKPQVEYAVLQRVPVNELSR
jgi:hypothetical protein